VTFLQGARRHHLSAADPFQRNPFTLDDDDDGEVQLARRPVRFHSRDRRMEMSTSTPSSALASGGSSLDDAIDLCDIDDDAESDGEDEEHNMFVRNSPNGLALRASPISLDFTPRNNPTSASSPEVIDLELEDDEEPANSSAMPPSSRLNFFRRRLWRPNSIEDVLDGNGDEGSVDLLDDDDESVDLLQQSQDDCDEDEVVEILDDTLE
jgi:hypothetical protein